MSPVKFKKTLWRPVDFKDQGPKCTVVGLSVLSLHCSVLNVHPGYCFR